MSVVGSKLDELKKISNTSSGQFKFNKGMFISGLVFGVLGKIFSPLVVLFLPAAFFLLFGGVLYGFIFRRTKDQVAALKQIKLLRKAVEDYWVEQGFDGIQLRQYKQDYDHRIYRIEYEGAVQNRFLELCKHAGVLDDGIFGSQHLLREE